MLLGAVCAVPPCTAPGCFLEVTAAFAAQHLHTAAWGCPGVVITSVLWGMRGVQQQGGSPRGAVTGDTTSVPSLGASSQWDVRLDGLTPGLLPFLKLKSIYTEGVSLLTPAF